MRPVLAMPPTVACFWDAQACPWPVQNSDSVQYIYQKSRFVHLRFRDTSSKHLEASWSADEACSLVQKSLQGRRSLVWKTEHPRSANSPLTFSNSETGGKAWSPPGPYPARHIL